MSHNVTIDQIVDYWSNHIDECGLGIDWSEAHERCWRCGYKTKLQKCHIIPDSLEGVAEPKIFVLLCGRCHREAPNIDDDRFMWIWLKSTSVPFYDYYWTVRGIVEFEEMFGRKPFEGVDIGSHTKDTISELMKEKMSKATIHFGEGRMNPSTIATIFALMEEQIIGIPVVVKVKTKRIFQ